jgi:hypothetical protein
VGRREQVAINDHRCPDYDEIDGTAGSVISTITFFPLLINKWVDPALFVTLELRLTNRTVVRDFYYNKLFISLMLSVISTITT